MGITINCKLLLIVRDAEFARTLLEFDEKKGGQEKKKRDLFPM